MNYLTISFFLFFSVFVSAGNVKKYRFNINVKKVNFTGETVEALSVGGKIPAPVIEATVGDILQVTFYNKMNQETSIHWHGVLLPNNQDGVPYLTTKPIAANSSFTYRFKVKHPGTYWYHSHTGLQEQRGVYGPLVFHPKKGKLRINYDETVVLSDWTNENPKQVLANIKKESHYYAAKKGTVISWLGAFRHGTQAIKNKIINSFFRMEGMDLSDVGYDAFLINGKRTSFLEVTSRQRVRLRLINAGASTYFNVEFSGGLMQIIEADGVAVESFFVKRLQMAIAETYDVIINVPKKKIYELRATAQDGTGHSSLFIGSGKKKVYAPKIKKPNLYLMSHSSSHSSMHSQMKRSGRKRYPIKHMTDYSKVRALKNTHFSSKKPRRKINLNLTGSMKRYVWGFNNKTLRESDKILIKKGEVVQFILNNKTMMAHPIHLHGHFFRVLNGQGKKSPLKHTVNVPAMSKVTIEFEADQNKDWFFHCHNLYHMKSGMSRVIAYEKTSLDRPNILNKISSNPFYFKGHLGLLSQMSEGFFQASSARNIFQFEYDWNYEKDYEMELSYARNLFNFLDIYVGARKEWHTSKENTDIFLGLRYMLPFLIESDISVTKNWNFRLKASSHMQLSTKLSLEWFYELQFRKMLENKDQEYGVTLSYELNKRASILGAYDSDFKWGAGMEFRF